MKRGRPNKRNIVANQIMEILSDGTARSVGSLVNEAPKRVGEKISWNTVQKYLQELVETNRIDAIATPHSKIEGKDGLTVYILKRR